MTFPALAMTARAASPADPDAKGPLIPCDRMIPRFVTGSRRTNDLVSRPPGPLACPGVDGDETSMPSPPPFTGR